ncbi:MAG: hypothetical protein PHF92_09525 [Bacteroidales bacterium]|nr:hypothetical protein [Bacteroidales bacterium]
MKKILLIAFISSLTVISSAAIYFTYVVKQDASLAGLYMGNVETLTSEESAYDCEGAPAKCEDSGSGCGIDECILRVTIMNEDGEEERLIAGVSATSGNFACCWQETDESGSVSVHAKAYSNECCPNS